LSPPSPNFARPVDGEGFPPSRCAQGRADETSAATSRASADLPSRRQSRLDMLTPDHGLCAVADLGLEHRVAQSPLQMSRLRAKRRRAVAAAILEDRDGIGRVSRSESSTAAKYLAAQRPQRRRGARIAS